MWTFSEVPEGIYDVWVTTAEGYLPRENSQKPGQVNDVSNSIYGNPKKVVVSNYLRIVPFQFVPYVQVNAGTRIRDRWTHESVSGCALSFTATSGDITNKTYTNYPFNAWYARPWSSGENGYFPTNVILMRVNYDLKIANSGYETLVRTNAIQNPGLGAVTNLGTLWLTPMDTNGNGIADRWEERYFGANRPPTTNDADEDGHNNYEEYRLGTDPTDRDSVMKLQISMQNTNGVTLKLAGRQRSLV